MQIAIIGAGAVGRGLIAPLLLERGHLVSFIEREDPLARGLSEGYYATRIALSSPIEMVGPVTCSLRDFDIRQSLNQADLIFVSVRVENLDSIPELLQRTRAPVILVENTPNAANLFMQKCGMLGITNGIAECVIPKSPYVEIDPTFCYRDSGGYLILEQAPTWIISGKIIQSIDFAFDWKLKWLYHCALHAVIGYVGIHRSIKYVSEVLNIKDLYDAILGLFVEVGKKTFMDSSLHHLGAARRLKEEFSALKNPAVLDLCSRVTRDPKRKIQLGERLDAIRSIVGNNPILSEAIEQAEKMAEDE